MTTKALQAENVLKQLNNKLNTVINGQLELPLSKLDNSRNIHCRTSKTAQKEGFLANWKEQVKKDHGEWGDSILK